ncbi:MAG: sigma-70 family RNA polymerase sigma factor [Flavobacteriales bacterium]|nr:sigma-70 family RNA polymerase sigma factor [Flavobacteriales bacterium]
MALDLNQEIEKAIKGEQKAFTKLLDSYWSDVYNFMLQRTSSENDAEDITIETFSKAFDKIHTYNNQFAFNTWLIAIGKNIHIDSIRKKKPDLNYNIDITEDQTANRIIDSSPTAEDALILEQNLSELLQFIKQLKPDYQEIIQLRYFQELSYNEISEQLNLPLSNVKVRLLRAKKLLAEIIQNTK